MIYVFVKNKLISCDSILPICMRINNETGKRFQFITNDRKTYLGLKKNIVLYEAINRIGSLRFVGSSQNKLIRKLEISLFLLKLIISGVLRRDYIIHFSQFNIGLHQKISSFFSGDRIIYAQHDSTGFSQKMMDVEHAKWGSVFNVDKRPAPKKGVLLSYCDKWLWLHDQRTKHLKRFMIRHPRMMSSWTNYVDEVFNKHVKEMVLRDKVVVIMLGFFGDLGMIKNDDSVKNCLIETLEVLNSLDGKNISIVMKPHVITDLVVLKEITDLYPDLDFHISYLHPTLLSRLGNFVVCNVYTTTVYDAFIQGLPVVEYTEYHPEALRVSKNGSSRPEFVTYFINRDKEKLQTVFEKLLNAERNKLEIPKVNEENEFFRIFKA